MSQSDDGSTSGDNFENEGLCQPGHENTGRWTSEEHCLFLKGLDRYGKGWKQIATLIQTRTVVQIRTHAQKYFQKLSKAQANGTAHLDPTTLMSTMDAGKARPASVSRNLRSSSVAGNTAESQGRLMSLRKRRNRGRHPRHDDDYDDQAYTGSDDGDEGDDDGSNGRTRRRRRRHSSTSSTSSATTSDTSSSSSSSTSGGRGGSSESEDDEGGEYRQRPGVMMMVRQEAPKFTVGGGGVIGRGGASKGLSEAATGSGGPGEEEVGGGGGGMDVSRGSNSLFSSTSSSSPRKHKRRSGASSSSSRRHHRSNPKKKTSRATAPSASAAAVAVGAADARALAWEAASINAQAAAAAAVAGTSGRAGAIDAAGGGTGGTMAMAGTKRNRSDSVGSGIGSASFLGDAVKSVKRSGGDGGAGSQSTRISPTSVSDVNFMSFPVPHMEDQQQHSDIAMHHLPPQLAPSWCTKPQDTWMASSAAAPGMGGSGFDFGVGDADDAGPFRWFIDERSLAAPGAFFQPPVETWSGSDTTDASASAARGVEGSGNDNKNNAAAATGVAGGGHHHQTTAVVPEPSVSTNKVDMSPVSGMVNSDIGDTPSSSSDPSESKRGREMEPLEMPIPMPMSIANAGDVDGVPVSDAAIASEVSRHVEADSAIIAGAHAPGGDGGGGDAGEGGSLDITSGLWLDHPQEATAATSAAAAAAAAAVGACGDAERNEHDDGSSPLMMYGLGLSAAAVSADGGGGLGGGGGGLGGLSLPSLDEEEVLGFLACADEGSNGIRPIAVGGDGFDI